MIAPFRKIKSKIPDLSSMQEAIDSVFNSIKNRQILDGRLIENISFVASVPKDIDHGLDKPVRGWIMTRTDTSGTLYESPSPLPNVKLRLVSSVDATISFWVF